jgi:DNA processing protein
MAVPGNVLSGRNRGGHALIRDGAKIVECADDIVEELGWTAAPASAHTSDSEAAIGRSVDRTATLPDLLLRKMQRGDAYDLDALAGATGLDVARLLPALADLELRGLIRRAGAGRFLRSS